MNNLDTEAMGASTLHGNPGRSHARGGSRRPMWGRAPAGSCGGAAGRQQPHACRMGSPVNCKANSPASTGKEKKHVPKTREAFELGATSFAGRCVPTLRGGLLGLRRRDQSVDG